MIQNPDLVNSFSQQVSSHSLPSYCAEGSEKEPIETKDVALALQDWGDSVSIYEATPNKHTQPILRPEVVQHSS